MTEEQPFTATLTAMVVEDWDRAKDLICEHVDGPIRAFSWASGFAKAIDLTMGGAGSGVVVQVSTFRLRDPEPGDPPSRDALLSAVGAVLAGTVNGDMVGALAVWRALSDEEQADALWTIGELAAMSTRRAIEDGMFREEGS